MDEKMIPVITQPGQFEPSKELPEGTKRVSWKAPPSEEIIVDFNFDVVYDVRNGQKSTLQILLPMPQFLASQPPAAPPTEKYPLIVYIPGSAWMKQIVLMMLPRMTKVCQRGFAVAIVEYRPSTLAPFPAQIEDAKTAIRYMRKHADEYNIDADRIAVWGDSSGGHTAVMAGITDDGVCDNGQYNEFPTDVKCIVDWFGPTDISVMGDYPSVMNHAVPESPEGLLIGRLNVLEHPELAKKTVPMNYLSKEKKVQPMLIMHGDVDDVVNFNQSCRLYDKMIETGQDVTFYKLEGSGHGTAGFASTEAVDTVCEFIRKHLG